LIRDFIFFGLSVYVSEPSGEFGENSPGLNRLTPREEEPLKVFPLYSQPVFDPAEDPFILLLG